MSVQMAVGLLWLVLILYIFRVERCLHAQVKVNLALYDFFDAIVKKCEEEERDSRS